MLGARPGRFLCAELRDARGDLCLAVRPSKAVGLAAVDGVETLVVLDVAGALGSRLLVGEGVAVDLERTIRVARVGDLRGRDAAESVGGRGTAGAATTTRVVVSGITSSSGVITSGSILTSIS